MRKILFLLFLTSGIKSGYADCTPGGMKFFPEQKEISLNPMFIVQGYAMSQKTIHSFKNQIVYLESENKELIELHLQEILKGQKELTQAVFCTSEELKPNTTYFLKYFDLTNFDEQESDPLYYVKGENVYWKTIDKKSIETLKSNLNLTYEKTEVVFNGCGPSANAIFDVNNKPKSEVWYKTEVVDLTTNEKNVYYIKEREGKLNIGHGMCSGAFTYNNKGKYKVRFTPMNIDGNSLKTTNWKSFESPFANNKSGF